MFPNDDICNIRAARKAAKRIFEKYGTSSPQNLPNYSSSLLISQKSPKSQNLLLGQQQVSILMKNAYHAINIDFTPSSEDISSFMQIFGKDNNNKISLGNMQSLAVKYLCGQENFIQEIIEKNKQNKKQKNNIIENTNKQSSINININMNEYINMNINNDNHNINNNTMRTIMNPQIKTNTSQIIKKDQNNKTPHQQNKKELNQQIKNKLIQQTIYKHIKNNINPRQQIKINNVPYQIRQNINFNQIKPSLTKGYLSPKARIQNTNNFSNINSNNNTNTNNSNLSYSLSLSNLNSSYKYQDNNNIQNGPVNVNYFIIQAQNIFIKHLIPGFKGIIITSAKNLLIQSYRLIGRKQYNPTDQDVKIWLKLCDNKRTGIIQWQSYQNFMRRLYQRQINHLNGTSSDNKNVNYQHIKLNYQ